MEAYCRWHHKKMEDVTEQEAAECLSYGRCETCEDCEYLGEDEEE